MSNTITYVSALFSIDPGIVVPSDVATAIPATFLTELPAFLSSVEGVLAARLSQTSLPKLV